MYKFLGENLLFIIERNKQKVSTKPGSMETVIIILHTFQL